LALAEYCEKRFGRKVKVNINPIVSSIGTSSTRVLYNNPDRLAWIIVNLSANEVYIGWNTGVSSTSGIRLDANGGNVVCLADEDLELVGYEVYAVATGANSNIFVLEVVAL
jgi:hypothetical protein